MKKLRRWIDRLACILPFEEAYFRAHGVNATFVGHPLFDQLPPERAGRRPDDGDGATRPPVVGLLPGLRGGEAEANFPRMLDGGAGRSWKPFPDARFLVPTTAATDPVVRATMEAAKQRDGLGVAECGRFERDAFDEMVPRCDLCLTVSGTATLHVAGLGVPMIVVYHYSPVLWNLLGRWLVRTRTYALVNVLAAGSPAEADPNAMRCRNSSRGTARRHPRRGWQSRICGSRNGLRSSGVGWRGSSARWTGPAPRPTRPGWPWRLAGAELSILLRSRYRQTPQCGRISIGPHGRLRIPARPVRWSAGGPSSSRLLAPHIA